MFDFNAYSGLLLVAVVQGVVYAVLLLVRQRREGRLHDGLAAAQLIVGTLFVAQWMLGFAGWYDGRDWRTTVMFYVEWSHLTALGPLLYLYFLAATNTDFVWRPRYWWHFLPAALFCVLPAALAVYDFGVHVGLRGGSFEYFGGTRGPAMEYEHSRLYALDTAEDYFVYAQLTLYLALVVRAYGRYRAYLTSEFANAEEYALTGLRNLVLIFAIGTALVFVSEAYACGMGASTYVDAWWRYLAVGVVVFAAAVQFHALHPRRLSPLRYRHDASPGMPAGTTRATEAQGGSAVEQVRLSPKPVTPRPPSPRPPERPALSPDEAAVCRRLDERLATRRDYLQPDLKLPQLAERLGTSPAVLSRVVNAHHGTNFSDFVNGLRCEAFLERIRAGEHERHTLLSLALDSGFNSKSTFNRAFRKRYGYPPGEAAARQRPSPE